MGSYVADFEPGGEISKGVGSLLQGGSPDGVAVWGGDVGPDPQDGAVPDYLSAQDSATSHQEAEEETGGVVVETVLIWKRQWRKRDLRILRPMSRGVRIGLHSIL